MDGLADQTKPTTNGRNGIRQEQLLGMVTGLDLGNMAGTKRAKHTVTKHNHQPTMDHRHGRAVGKVNHITTADGLKAVWKRISGH